MSTQVKSFVMNNVSFDFIMAATGNSLTTYNYLLWFINTKETILITNCNFMNILANSIIYVDIRTLSYEEYTFDEYNNIVEFKETNFLLSNSKFSNIGFLISLVSYIMQSIVQSFKIESCSFKEIVSGNNGVFLVSNLGQYSSFDMHGGYTSIESNGSSKKAYIFSKKLIFLHENDTLA